MRELNATVLENIEIAPMVYSLTFGLDEEIAIRPGQFCMIGVHGYSLKRPIAVCKTEGERVTVCFRVKGGGTRALAGNYRLKEKIPVLLPLGNGFSVPEEARRIAVVGGGVGIFPLISAIRAYTGTHEVYAYMGFRSKADICLEYEMRRAELILATDDGSAGFHGNAVQAFMKDVDGLQPDIVLSCGPLLMLRALKNSMRGRDIPVFVSLEERMGCGIGACLVCVCDREDGSRARVCRDGPVFDINEINF